VNPFAALGLDARPDLTDEEVRAAWRSIAASAHPDRADGGNPDSYAAASAAYAALRTGWGRSEAYADLIGRTIPPARPSAAPAPAAAARIGRAARLVPARIRHGRPAFLALRVLAAAGLAEITLHARAGTAATAGVLAGIIVWLAITARGDLAPPPGR